MIINRPQLGILPEHGQSDAPIAPLTNDWSPWIIGGAIILSGVIALIAANRANRG